MAEGGGEVSLITPDVDDIFQYHENHNLFGLHQPNSIFMKNGKIGSQNPKKCNFEQINTFWFKQTNQNFFAQNYAIKPK